MMLERFEPAGSGSFIEFLPEQGGAIHQIGLDAGRGGSPILLLAPDSPGEMQENPWFRGRFLFPFNDRIPRGRYVWRGVAHQLPVNDAPSGDAIHGFAYRLPARVTRRDPETGRLSLQAEVVEEPGYPFRVRLTVDVHIAQSVRFELTVVNTGEVAAPLSVGWHPYFRFPASGGRNVTLKRPATHYVPVDDSLLPTGGILPVTGTAFDFTTPRYLTEDELDLAYTDPTGEVILAGDAGTVRMELDTSFFPYLQVFLPPDRRSIALEPVTAATNAFNLPSFGLIELEPGEKRSGWVTITATHARD